MTKPDIAERIRNNLAAWLPTSDHTQEARILMAEAAIEIERTARNRDMWKGQCGRQADELERLRAEGENLRTVMIAAAEEIHQHWAAHCDSEGYGPVNLMHRLEAGVPSRYAYRAGDFARLKLKNERLRAEANAWAAEAGRLSAQIAFPAAPAQQAITPEPVKEAALRASAITPESAQTQQAHPDSVAHQGLESETTASRPTQQATPSLTVGESRPPTPTAGMTIAQRILHVGGRNNAAGYVEFGSTQAVEALVRQVLRDLPAAPAGRTNSGDETGGAVKRFGLNCTGSGHEIIPATNGAFVWYDDYLTLWKSAQAQPAAQQEAQEPVAFAVYWGLGEMRKNSVHFERKTAEEAASAIKSATEIRPLYASPQPAPSEGDARDAARYRWLLKRFSVTTLPCFLEKYLACGYIADGEISINSAIDAAMKESAK